MKPRSFDPETLIVALYEILADDDVDAEARCALSARLIEALGPDSGLPARAAEQPAQTPARRDKAAKPHKAEPSGKSRPRSKKKATKKSGAGRLAGSKTEAAIRVLQQLGRPASVSEVGAALKIAPGSREAKLLGQTLANAAKGGHLKRTGKGIYALS